jgi:hypothetical protein
MSCTNSLEELKNCSNYAGQYKHINQIWFKRKIAYIKEN